MPRKPRIPVEEYQKILDETKVRINRKNKFEALIKGIPFPDNESSDPNEAYKAQLLIKTIKDNGYDIFDIATKANGFIVRSENDTHSKNRAFEKFLGGRCDGKPDPDCLWGEIKLSQIIAAHTLEQIMTVGKIYKSDRKTKTRSIPDNFLDSSIYKKLKNCLITTYFQEGKQLGHKISNCFIFKVDEDVWFQRIKEDWEFYRNEYLAREKLLSEGKIKRRASGIMKSDSDGERCPNHSLGIRSDSIVFTQKFFSEVSKYYDK